MVWWISVGHRFADFRTVGRVSQRNARSGSVRHLLVRRGKEDGAVKVAPSTLNPISLRTSGGYVK